MKTTIERRDRNDPMCDHDHAGLGLGWICPGCGFKPDGPGCLLCVNVLPPGEHCRACGRVNNGEVES